MSNNKIIYSCLEHVEEAMDDIVNMQETFPIMEACINEKCNYCNNTSDYELKVNSK
ncbi:CxxH/CxxC protein [Clostridium gasigenes]|uniref:CxxH/CxxC protein n=1 Tax=Clostridium gasigenes TaxID=94869 RepID=UPI001C0B1DBD|nr:CxxH/CxxC protein [Clostridium gasigenes]MBU3109646.1 CxxH/CxxC protein [Clostridium gasigenes]